MTAEDFDRAYAARSGVTTEWLRMQGRFVAPCDCGDALCEGWQMDHAWEEALFEEWERSRAAEEPPA